MKILLLFLLLTSFCSHSQTQSQLESNKTEAVISTADSPIRSIDFRNFTYPFTEGLIDPINPKRTFTLKNGELPETRNKQGLVDEMGIYLGNVIYGDVTNDNQEDAIVTISILTGGSATPQIVYVFTLENNRPKQLWAFSTGDRADKGLRKVYAENGQLVIELNSPIDSKGDCCPVFFTRSKYRWTGKNFQEVENQDKLPVS
jgi:hypothetical protein